VGAGGGAATADGRGAAAGAAGEQYVGVRPGLSWEFKAKEILRRLPREVEWLTILFDSGDRIDLHRPGGTGSRRCGFVVPHWLNEAADDVAIDEGVKLCLASLNPHAEGLLPP
jgi:hypothetical protein